MFICNHCPYVVSALDEIIYEAKELIKNDIAVIAISSNDVSTHPEDSFENMKALSADKKLPFPYLYDETQEVAKATTLPAHLIFLDLILNWSSI